MFIVVVVSTIDVNVLVSIVVVFVARNAVVFNVIDIVIIIILVACLASLTIYSP